MLLCYKLIFPLIVTEILRIEHFSIPFEIRFINTCKRLTIVFNIDKKTVKS